MACCLVATRHTENLDGFNGKVAAKHGKTPLTIWVSRKCSIILVWQTIFGITVNFDMGKPGKST